MVSHLSAIGIGVLGILAGLLLGVLMMAGGANSTPAVSGALRVLGMLLVVGLLVAVVGVIWGILVGRPEVGLTGAVGGWLLVLCVGWAWWQMGSDVLPADWKVPVGKVVVRTLVMLVFGGGGMAMFYVGAREYRVQGILLSEAREMEVEIVESGVKKIVSKPAGDTDAGRPRAVGRETVSWRPEVKFKYAVGGKAYESEQIRPSVIGRDYAGKDSAEAEVAAFPVGAKVKGWVSEKLPERGYLVKEEGGGPVVFLIVGPLTAVVALVVTRWL